jgi:prolyl-tRNA editing enzyme YbaK/EbsC (Cys-tRNA(Pro) deacylase)
LAKRSRSDRGRINVCADIAATSRTVAPDRAIEAARVAIRSLGVNPDRAASAVRETDAAWARQVIAGVLYRMSRVSLQRAATILRTHKATTRARIAAFERLSDRDEVLSRARQALSQMPA